MKKIILLITITLSTVGCGMAEDLTRACGGSLTQLCDMLFGRDSDKIDELKEEIDDLIAELAALEDKTIVEYIDPCGPSGGYDEILMVTGDGKHIAYFQEGNGNNQRRHLTILKEDIIYQTTDAQQCPFSIVNGQYQGQR